MRNISQTEEFLIFCLIGIIISLIFDFFRSIRKNFKTPDYVTYIEDIIFLVISSTIFMLSILKISYGILRFYIFLAIFLGITIYSLTFSKFCIIIMCEIIAFCKKILNLIKNISAKFINLFKKLVMKICYRRNTHDKIL